jgi:hypothetical protein
MANTRDGVARAIAMRSPVDIDGTSFTLTLSDFKESLLREVKHIEVLFVALSTEARHTGILHLGLDKYSDDEIADLAVNTIRDVVRGKPPPGTVVSASPFRSPPRAEVFPDAFRFAWTNRYSDCSENGVGGGDAKRVRLKI